MHKSYFIYGTEPVLTALENKARIIKNLFVTDSSSPFCKNSRNLKAQVKDRKFFNQILGEVNHQNVAIEVMPLAQNSYDQYLKKETATILILDQITDPHNVGAILRSACAFGIDCVILPNDNSPLESGIIAKTSAGAIEITPLIYVTNLVNFIKEAKNMGFWCYGADGTAQTNLYQEKFAAKRIIIMGSEGKGIRKLVKENCDVLIKIPTSGKIESLNVSCAASIILSQLFH